MPLLWSEPAGSQEANRPSNPARVAADQAQPVAAESEPAEADNERAAAAYKESLTRYAAGDLAGALESMSKSYRLSGHPSLLYNLARLEHELGDCPAALAHYRKYVVAVPQGQYRPEAESASRQLQARCDSAQVTAFEKPIAPVLVNPRESMPPARPTLTTKPQPVAHHVAPSYFTPTRWLGWSLIATSALAGAGALYVRSLAVEARNDFQASVDRQRSGGALADHGLEDDQHRKEVWAATLAITGGALVGGGIAVLLLEPSGQTSGRVSLFVEPGGLGAGFRHTF